VLKALNLTSTLLNNADTFIHDQEWILIFGNGGFSHSPGLAMCPNRW